MKNKNLFIEIIFLLNQFFLVLGFFMHIKDNHNIWSMKMISIGIVFDIILNLYKNLEKNRIKVLVISLLKMVSIVIFLLLSFELAITFFITVLLIDFLSPIIIKSKI